MKTCHRRQRRVRQPRLRPRRFAEDIWQAIPALAERHEGWEKMQRDRCHLVDIVENQRVSPHHDGEENRALGDGEDKAEKAYVVAVPTKDVDQENNLRKVAEVV
eukprot:CAMPEP_0174894986 /NCGR_PEP_ID=MMETSP0167-20121228/9487_1 /TAXON_ID=38298 /ORGANISM="Rhodella maculata, Strain CCMP736" /LENGTH=103 /DNA_ID=CAMNT_0016134205 /DNA_START=327 /DNA_END=634 /DNA_ORIENTATION=-